MCKKLVSLEIYDSASTAFRTFNHLKNETGMQWNMYKNAPDIYGRTSFMIYGLFENDDLVYAQNTIINIDDKFIYGDDNDFNNL